MTEHAAIERLRRICLAFAGTREVETWGVPTFRVDSKIFAIVEMEPDRTGVWIKTPRSVHAMLIAGDPDRFYPPPYLTRHGWRVRLTGKNWRICWRMRTPVCFRSVV